MYDLLRKLILKSVIIMLSILFSIVSILLRMLLQEQRAVKLQFNNRLWSTCQNEFTYQ